MFKTIENFGAKLAKVSSTIGLIRLKVFHQILLLIMVLVVFLSIQTFVNINIINSMQKASHNIYGEGSYKSSQISKLKQDLLRLQTSYLETMASPTVSGFNESSIRKILIPDWFDQESKKVIADKLDSMKKLVLNPNQADYEAFRAELNEALLRVGMLEAQISSDSAKKIMSNERFLIESRINGIVIVVISLFFAVCIGLVIANSISVPLKQVEAASKAIAEGDLTRNIKTGGSPEIIRVVNGLNQAIYGLRELVRNIDSQSEALYQASQELQTASSETGKSSSAVAQAIEEIAKGSSKQAEQTIQAANTIQTLSEIVKGVSSGIESITLSSDKVAQAAQVGLKSTCDIRDEIQELYLSTRKIAEVIHELSNATEEINELISTIRGVAEQTTLLALNASIEAARAGEHGKGFAVVAFETGKLAEQSKQSTGLIVDLIGKIKSGTDEAVTIVRKGMERAENGKNFAIQTSETFEDIFKSLNENLIQIQTVAKSAKKMTEDNKVVIEAINEIAAISEESMAGTEEVSATAEQQSASSQEVAALSENLSQIASCLHQSVAAFQLEQKPDKT